MMRTLTLPSRLARTSCSVLALATVLVVGATPAAAQSFLGTGSVTNGSATITTGVNTTNISVTTPQTVIDWVPFDNAIANNTTIAFQNSGTTATFAGSGNFAVLNRINPADSTRSITMNGLIQAIPTGAAISANGSIYFYTPGGFVLGASSIINVGSLVLSASPITVDGSGNFINGLNNTVTFGQATNPLARILTTAGSQINASAGDAYVAMVAPRVEHRGSINVSGSAALVGAEAATINFSPDGLFDIQVTTGTTDANGVYSSGTITGAASTGAADIHRAYLVAVPKNSALTMAIIQGGSLGFNIAGAANVDGNTVVLSAGYNITDGVIDPFLASAGGANKANISVSGANMTSALTAAASGVADIFSTAGQSSNFASDVTVRAVDHVWVNASGSSATLNIAGNLDMSSTHWPSVDGQSNTGGFLALYASPGGTVTVGGNASLISLGSGGSSATGGLNGGSGTGGQIWVQSEGNSTLSIGGNLTTWAGGYGGSAGAAGANGGTGTGGQILIRNFGANSLLSVGGSTSANADGYGGNATACGGCSGAGGIGTGGQISVYSNAASGSTMTLSDAVFLNASGRGGSSANGGAGGGGTGGSVTLSAGAGSTLALNDRLHADASGFGGSGSAGGNALGGTISLYSAGTLTIGGTDPTSLLTEAAGGTGLSATAGDAQGGTITIIADKGGSLTLTNSLFASADAWGGHAGGAGADGGDGTGGTIALYPTGNGSSITAQSANLHADGYGGRGDGLECFTCNGDGGNGTGGETFVGDGFYFSSLSANNSIDLAGSLTMSANGTGGVGVGVSGNGTGGSAELLWYATTTGSVDGNVSISSVGRGGDNYTGGTAGNGYGFGAIVGPDGGLTLGANLYLDASGYGGSTFNIGGGTGGIGDGGVARLFNGLGTISIVGNHQALANGFGGNAYLGTGGDGIGGLAPLNASDSAILIGGWADISASGTGGNGDTGGDGTGGIARALTTGGNLTIGGDATVIANAFGGLGNSGDGGDAYGGDAYIQATNGTLTINGDTRLNALGFGGGANASLTAAGDGYGGDATIRALSGGTINLGATLLARASAFGGDVFNSGTTGGDAQGGNVLVEAIAANAKIIVAGAASLRSYAAGSGDGNGTGGSVRVEAYGASTASLDFQSDLEFLTVGQGGGGYGPTGDGQGGEALLRSTAGSQISVGGDAILNSNAFGGYNYDFTSGSGGDAVGGTARIETYGTDGVGGNIDIVGNAIVRASGVGGDAWGTNFNGGNGTGGNAHILTTLGTITIGNDASVYANGIGGYAAGGTGGDGFGGTLAEIAAINGDINIGGHAAVSASGFGGDGKYGGDGVGGGESILEEDGSQTIIDGARIFAKNGDIVIGNGATVSASGAGGDGGSDNGYGADYGGDGGDGFGGYAKILAQNGDLGPSSITIVSTSVEGSGTALVDVDGTGGNGGNGRNNNVGGNGGRGGNGFGGSGGIYAAAGNGLVTIDDAIVRALGIGGSGGIGGNGDGGAGGNGGRGGNGVGGTADVGTISGGNGEALGSNNGVGNYGTISADASAVGGVGGRGSSGATNGNGGNGGNATGGRALILVRGSTVNVEAATLTANATGGNAGFGAAPASGTPGITGIGGNATVGGANRGIHVLATGRFQLPAQRGTLNAGAINGTAIATAGIGIPNGSSASLGGSGVVFLNADGDIGSLDFLVQLIGNESTAGVDSISVINGDVVVGGEFSFVTPGDLSLFANNGDMHAGNLTLSAGNFVFDPVNDPPSDRGTYFADSATITTGNNFVTSANLDVGSDLSIIAPGLIDAQQFTIDGDLNLWAQSGGITATILDVTGRADLNAAGSILITSALAGFFDADAGGSFTSGNITSDTNIQINTDGNMTLGNLLAGLNVDPGADPAVELESDGSILMGNVTALGGIDFSADGSVTGGDLTSGLAVFGDAEGAVSLGAISGGLVSPQGVPDEGFSVGITSATSITTGNVAGAYAVGFATLGPITTGTINAGTDFLVMASGNMLFGPITAAGRVYLADSSMFIAAGGGEDDNFDPELVFNAIPVASVGSITIDGPVSAGSFTAAAGTTFASGQIDAAGDVDIFAGTSVTTPDITGDGIAITTDTGAIAVGDLLGNGVMDLDAGSSIVTGTITNSGPTNLTAGTSISIGALDAGIGPVTLLAGGFIGGDIVDAGSIYAESGDTITLGNLTAPGDVELYALSDIDVGTVLAGETIDVEAGGSVDGGNFTAGDSVYVEAGGPVGLLAISAGLVDPSTAIDAEYNVGILSGATIDTGNIAAANHIGLGALGDITVGTINAGDIFMALGGSDMSFGTIISGGPTYLADASMIALGGDTADFDPNPILAAIPTLSGGSIELGGSVTAGSFTAAAGTTLTGTTINSNGLLYATSGGNMTLTNLSASGDVRLTSGGNIATGRINSGDDVALAATGSITTLDIFAYDDVSADAGTTITTDDITGNSINLFAVGDITTDDLLTRNFFIDEAAPPLVPGSSISVVSNADIDVGNVDALDGVHVSADGSITAGTIVADSFVQLYADGAITAGNINAGTSLRMTAGSTINGGNLTAGTLARVSAAGAVNVGNITIINNIDGAESGGGAVFDVGTGPPVEVFGASIATGNIATPGYVGLYTPGSLTVGTINAGHDVIALVGTNAAFGAIKTAERFFLGGYSMFALADGGESFSPALVFGAPKAKTGGTASFAGASTAASFEAYVGTDTTLQSLQTSDFALIDTGGMFSLDGTLGGDSRVISNDIALGTTSAINGEIHLTSRNATQTLIGDGLDALGQGYRLSDAEADRINAVFTIGADTAYGAAAKMIIGDLSINVAGSSGRDLEYGFGTVNGNADNPSVGSIKVVGDVTFTGLDQFDEVAFDTNLFQLDAATGSIALFSEGTTLGGTLGLYAPRVWVASGDILSKLEANSTYSGYIAELNAPAAVQRPEGVLRAGSIDIDSGEESFQSFLVQNTGTVATPAGFVLTDSDLSGDEGSDDPPGSINLVINGQIITAQGTLTGIAVRDLLVAGAVDTSSAVAGSTINGCVLVGPCASAPPRVDTPTRTDVQLTGNNGLGDGLFGNEGDIDDGESGDGGDRSSPISPPMPLFDSRPLVQSGDVDDPVSGAGNPSLFGSPDDEDEEEDEEKKKAKAKQGDGK